MYLFKIHFLVQFQISGNRLYDVVIDYIDSRTWKTTLMILKETWRLDLN